MVGLDFKGLFQPKPSYDSCRLPPFSLPGCSRGAAFCLGTRSLGLCRSPFIRNSGWVAVRMSRGLCLGPFSVQPGGRAVPGRSTWPYLASSSALLPAFTCLPQAGQGSSHAVPHAPFAFIPPPVTRSPHMDTNLPLRVPSHRCRQWKCSPVFPSRIYPEHSLG